MIPLCQDTGTSVVFVEVGQEVHIVGGTLEDAVNRGVAKGYTEGYLRKSMVTQPFSARKNTGDNTPAVIHVDLVPGDRLRIKTMPKGGGCENMSRMTILLPGQGREGVVNFVLRAVEEASGNPCPPLVLGVGIGGSAEYCMALAKKAITRRVGDAEPGRRDGGPGARAAGEGERARSRPAGGRRQEHGAGGARRDVPHAHHGAAGCGQHPVSQRPHQRSGAIGEPPWISTFACP